MVAVDLPRARRELALEGCICATDAGSANQGLLRAGRELALGRRVRAADADCDNGRQAVKGLLFCQHTRHGAACSFTGRKRQSASAQRHGGSRKAEQAGKDAVILK